MVRQGICIDKHCAKSLPRAERGRNGSGGREKKGREESLQRAPKRGRWGRCRGMKDKRVRNLSRGPKTPIWFSARSSLRTRYSTSQSGALTNCLIDNRVLSLYDESKGRSIKAHATLRRRTQCIYTKLAERQHHPPKTMTTLRPPGEAPMTTKKRCPPVVSSYQDKLCR